MKAYITKEVFKDIPGYEGIYQVSDLGSVKSLERNAWNGFVWHKINTTLTNVEWLIWKR